MFLLDLEGFEKIIKTRSSKFHGHGIYLQELRNAIQEGAESDFTSVADEIQRSLDGMLEKIATALDESIDRKAIRYRNHKDRSHQYCYS